MALAISDDDKPARSLEEAVARVLRGIQQAEHPVVNVTIGRYNVGAGDDLYGLFYWEVMQQPVRIHRGATKKSDHGQDTDWAELGKKLVEDIDRAQSRPRLDGRDE